MDRRPSAPSHAVATVLGTSTDTTAEDPFGPGDPLEVARLVRRALAAASRKAVDVAGLVVVTDRAPSAEALGRFVRRALGPQGDRVRVVAHVAMGATHAARRARAITAALGPPAGKRPGDGLVVAVVLGPNDQATVLCLGVQRHPEHPDPDR